MEHLSSLEEAQAVCLWERASILEPGQRGRRYTRGLTVELQDIINHHRHFCRYTRALDARRILESTSNVSLVVHESAAEAG